MEEVLILLKDDHLKIDESCSRLEDLIDQPLGKNLKLLEQELKFFRDFITKEHHKREEIILYDWMRAQNPSAQNEIIDNICEEHQKIEDLVRSLLHKLQDFKKDKGLEATIASEIQDLLFLYKEHIEREEKFIFLLASTFSLSKDHENDLINKMKSFPIG